MKLNEKRTRKTIWHFSPSEYNLSGGDRAVILIYSYSIIILWQTLDIEEGQIQDPN